MTGLPVASLPAVMSWTRQCDVMRSQKTDATRELARSSGGPMTTPATASARSAAIVPSAASVTIGVTNDCPLYDVYVQ